MAGANHGAPLAEDAAMHIRRALLSGIRVEAREHAILLETWRAWRSSCDNSQAHVYDDIAATSQERFLNFFVHFVRKN